MLPGRRPDGDVVAVYLEPSGRHTRQWHPCGGQVAAIALWRPLGSKYTATTSPSGRRLGNISMCADRENIHD